jgi:FtsH-binding integral membrane protein
MGMAGLGLSFAPMMGMFNMVNPAIIPTSIVLSASIFGSASLYAYTRPKDSLISWGSSLYSALFGMIGL